MEVFSFKPRNAEKVIAEIKERFKGNEKATNDIKIESKYAFSDKSYIDVYKTNSVVFTGRHADFCEFREMDMRLDVETVERTNKNAPSLCNLNFAHTIIGSDETGKGEVFKPMIVTAVCLKGEDEVLKYIRMGVNDSKQIKGKINAIGKEVTGIGSWQEIMDTPLIANDLFVTRIVTNEEYNRRCHENGDNKKDVQHHLLTEAHLQVLREAYKRHPDSTIVVDDFTDGKGVDAFKDTLAGGTDGIHREKTYLTTEGDGKVMAISLASAISDYICNLGFEYVQTVLNQTYRQETEATMKLPKGAEIPGGVEQFLKKLKPERKDEFMDKYCKKYFENIWDVINK